ncbi:hypothetical protein ACFQ48_06460 [Hymenobacter caeli]|uniref:YtxH domain-containing protein n=1 Tax=Hymenobacter caeli TaxID=2735894 RepID=A0ABX2FNS3_9BACT|nr:hypothetical protein [Hymenobacter caeli]NRT18823.1 hypothetical protein [Hymenobacter caeli]
MSDPHNPLFENEKEFLEQKKREYERALRGDVAQIKEKTVQVGKVAAAGAGLAGSVWLITRLLGGKKNRPRRYDNDSGPAAGEPKGKKDKKGPKDPNAPKSAAASAAVFQEVLGFDEPADKWAPVRPAGPPPAPAAHDPDPFEPQPAAPALPKAPAVKPLTPVKPKAAAPKKDAPASGEPRGSWLKSAAGSTLGTLVKAAWQSDTARGLITQALAAGVAAVAGHSAVKSAVEDAQAPKNPDLAARADAAAADAGAAGPFPPAQPSSPDAPRQHPA